MAARSSHFTRSERSFILPELKHEEDGAEEVLPTRKPAELEISEEGRSN